MAKRFLDTDFFKSPFVGELSADCKLLYVFIICDCDYAGVWTPNFQVASIYLGRPFTETDFRECFKGKFVEISRGKFFFSDFIEHQYPSGLSESNRSHTGIIKLLKKHNLWNDENKPLISPLQGSKEKEEDKEMEMDKEMEEEKEEKAKIELWPSFEDEDFWDLYDKKIGRPKAESKWDKLKQKTKGEIMSYLPAYVSATERDNKKYRKNPTTFLNNQSWKDEIIEDRKATPKDRRENLTNLLYQRGHIPSNV